MARNSKGAGQCPWPIWLRQSLYYVLVPRFWLRGDLKIDRDYRFANDEAYVVILLRPISSVHLHRAELRDLCVRLGTGAEGSEKMVLFASFVKAVNTINNVATHFYNRSSRSYSGFQMREQTVRGRSTFRQFQIETQQKAQDTQCGDQRQADHPERHIHPFHARPL